MNAGILADGLRRGGAAEARKALAQLLGGRGPRPGYASSRIPGDAGRAPHLEPGAQSCLLWQEMLTEYLVAIRDQSAQLQSAAQPPRAHRLRRPASGSRRPRVFICATIVRTGLRRVFENQELSADVLLASAALPQVYQAVEIDGEYYWDGGYTGNPALAPLYLSTQASDLIVVGINPIVRSEVPRTARAITDRIGEISYNSTFMGEVAAIAFLRGADAVAAGGSKVSDVFFVHGIGDDALGALRRIEQDEQSSLTSSLDLREIGTRAADRWLADHRKPWASARRSICPGSFRRGTARSSAHPSLINASRFKNED
jgi:predicted acylesterase/phospholipase RssA